MPKQTVQEVRAVSPDGVGATVSGKVFRTVLQSQGWKLEGEVEVLLPVGEGEAGDEHIEVHETGNTVPPALEDPFADPDKTLADEVDEEFAALRSEPKPAPVRTGKKN